MKPAQVLWATLKPEVQQCLNLLNDCASDPILVVRKILLCLPAKVLGAHYSSDVEASSPKTLENSFSSLFEFPSSPNPSLIMENWVMTLPWERPSKRSLLPCQVNPPSTLPTKHTCQCFSPPLPPHSILELSSSTSPSDCEQPIKSTFASLSLPSSIS